MNVFKNKKMNIDRLSHEEYLKIYSQKDCEFIISGDEQKNFCFTKSKSLKLHLNVLPHPYFGNIDNPRVLFLAKNPSYDENYDEQETFTYLKNHSDDLSNYVSDLEKVDFFKSWSEKCNESFFNSWNWWNNKVIGGAKLKINSADVGFLNLCSYHSKNFDIRHFNNLPSMELNQIIKTLENKRLELIIVVWDGAILDELKPYIEKKDHIILNVCKDKKGQTKNATNINSLKKIIDGKYNDLYESCIINKLKENYFE